MDPCYYQGTYQSSGSSSRASGMNPSYYPNASTASGMNYPYYPNTYQPEANMPIAAGMNPPYPSTPLPVGNTPMAAGTNSSSYATSSYQPVATWVTATDMDRAISRIYYGEECPRLEKNHTYWASKLKRAVTQGLFTPQAFDQCTMKVDCRCEHRNETTTYIGYIIMTIREPMDMNEGFSLRQSLKHRFKFMPHSVWLSWDKRNSQPEEITEETVEGISREMKERGAGGARDMLLLRGWG